MEKVEEVSNAVVLEEVNKAEKAENVESCWRGWRKLKNTKTRSPRHRSRRPMPRDCEHVSLYFILCVSRGGEMVERWWRDDGEMEERP